MLEVAYKVDRTQECVELMQDRIVALSHVELKDCYNIKKYLNKHINADLQSLLIVG